MSAGEALRRRVRAVVMVAVSRDWVSGELQKPLRLLQRQGKNRSPPQVVEMV
jgi:hypothetical protein